MQEARVFARFRPGLLYAIQVHGHFHFFRLQHRRLLWIFSISSRGHEKFLLFTTRVLSFQFFFKRFFSVCYFKEPLQDTKQLELTAQDHSLHRGIGCEPRQTSKVGTIAWFRMMAIPNHATLSMHDAGSWVKCQVFARGAN